MKQNEKFTQFHRSLRARPLLSKRDQTAASTVIGNILLLTLTLLLGAIVLTQSKAILDSVDLTSSVDDYLGRGKDDEASVTYTLDFYDDNLTIFLTSVSKRVEIPRVNYVLYNLTIKEKTEAGYLIDIKDANDTNVRYIDFDNDGHFSRGDKVIVHFDEENPLGDILIEFNDNKHPDRTYSLRLQQEDFAKI